MAYSDGMFIVMINWPHTPTQDGVLIIPDDILHQWLKAREDIAKAHTPKDTKDIWMEIYKKTGMAHLGRGWAVALEAHYTAHGTALDALKKRV